MKWYKKFEDWFELKFGWFFINGMKVDRWTEKLRKKYLDEN